MYLKYYNLILAKIFHSLTVARFKQCFDAFETFFFNGQVFISILNQTLEHISQKNYNLVSKVKKKNFTCSILISLSLNPRAVLSGSPNCLLALPVPYSEILVSHRVSRAKDHLPIEKAPISIRCCGVYDA